MLFIDVFDKQDVVYCEFVLLKVVFVCVVIEVGIVDYWFKYVGLNGVIVGMIIFGEFVLVELLFEEFGFMVDNVIVKVKVLL